MQEMSRCPDEVQVVVSMNIKSIVRVLGSDELLQQRLWYWSWWPQQWVALRLEIQSAMIWGRGRPVLNEQIGWSHRLSRACRIATDTATSRDQRGLRRRIVSAMILHSTATDSHHSRVTPLNSISLRALASGNLDEISPRNQFRRSSSILASYWNTSLASFVNWGRDNELSM